MLFLRLHTLPERIAHKSHKLQFEIVAVLGLIALFTHMHIFWVAGLILALIDIPDFGGRLDRMADLLEAIAGKVTERKGVEETVDTTTDDLPGESPGAVTRDKTAMPRDNKELTHA